MNRLIDPLAPIEDFEAHPLTVVLVLGMQTEVFSCVLAGAAILLIGGFSGWIVRSHPRILRSIRAIFRKPTGLNPDSSK